ncbi:hypothetical protein K9L27_04385 [Candidatus Gracilibacteria bacterium]|nr:hypothetical protein [Candidatus Gracilibacteria bacterium]
MPNLKSHIQLSTHEKMRRNPIPWIVLLTLSMVFLGLIVFPMFSDWQNKKTLITSLESRLTRLTEENEIKKKEKEMKEIEFNIVAGPHLEGEKQLFPESIDTAKVARILELYALQLENLDTQNKDSYFVLEKLSFGTTQKEKAQSYSATDLTLGFSTDEENFETFVRFLQSGTLSERIQKGKDRGQIQLVDYKFLQDNLLPILHIDSIKISSREKVGTGNTSLDIQMKIRLFSQ